MFKFISFIALLVAVSIGVMGCPPEIDIELGDWLLSVQVGGAEWGLTLNPDGSVTPFDEGAGVLDGVITWETDGHHLMITRITQYENQFFDAWIESPTSASGLFYLNGANIGNCYLRKKPVAMPGPVS